MGREQKNAPSVEAATGIDLAIQSFDVQLARQFDYDLTTYDVLEDRTNITTSNPVTQALDLGKNYATVTQSYMVGSGEAANFEQFSSEVHMMTYDFTARVMMDLKNSFVAQATIASPSSSERTDNLAFQFDIYAASRSADPRDRGIANGSQSDIQINDINLARITKDHDRYIDNSLSLVA
jgi:hypothetical protein